MITLDKAREWYNVLEEIEKEYGECMSIRDIQCELLQEYIGPASDPESEQCEGKQEKLVEASLASYLTDKEAEGIDNLPTW